ncbi:hypothetical protein B0A49_00061 [Cryomyces minteri]|uniref:Initiator tRNA phosphoribosyl transferase n=1 Tax=Cryomyces minteri TaxID=331657 RepID=A0A4U0Y0A8_9PEZI|nr:hypothetical protein B0A49_00061 [Cryomyces minteri]
MSKPLQTADLIFSSASTDFSWNRTLGELKRSALSITNRLRSIEQDSTFVCAVADAYNLPLVANERCGSWYIPPERKAGSVYFKSTDGHAGEWSFSMRRLNLQVLDIIGAKEGCIIVDSTRRGKSMPDALSKTVPIWCAVLNRVVFPELAEAQQLYTPPSVVSRSEHAQIEATLDTFVRGLRLLGIDFTSLRAKVAKPLRPMWVTQSSPLPLTAPTYEDFHPVVLCTSSRRVHGGEVSEGTYVQGAGDDSEGWAHGLTAQTFWSYKDLLMTTPEESLPRMIGALESLDELKRKAAPDKPFKIEATSSIHIGMSGAAASNCDNFDFIVTCGDSADPALTRYPKARYLHLQCASGKLGSRNLRKELPKLQDFMVTNLAHHCKSLLVCCSNGKDLSVGVALTILCRYVDQNGGFLTENALQLGAGEIDKSFIRQRLSWIMTSIPDAKPSNATLQSVNAFLMTQPNWS